MQYKNFRSNPMRSRNGRPTSGHCVECGRLTNESMGGKRVTTPAQIQNLMKEYHLKKEWAFADSTSENIAIGRRGELFIKEQEEFVVVADKIKTNSKSDFDLILRGYGSVDSKVTKLRKTASGTYRHKFNVANVSKTTKYVFCVGYNEDYSEPMILLKFPYQFVKGKQSLSVSVEGIFNSKYKAFIHKIYPSNMSYLYGDEYKDGYPFEEITDIYLIIEKLRKKLPVEVYANLLQRFEDMEDIESLRIEVEKWQKNLEV